MEGSGSGRCGEGRGVNAGGWGFAWEGKKRGGREEGQKTQIEGGDASRGGHGA